MDPVQPATNHNQSKVVVQTSLDEMITAFNTFHKHMTALNQEQRHIIQDIRSRVDKKKIQQILETIQKLS